MILKFFDKFGTFEKLEFMKKLSFYKKNLLSTLKKTLVWGLQTRSKKEKANYPKKNKKNKKNKIYHFLAFRRKAKSVMVSITWFHVSLTMLPKTGRSTFS